MNVILSVLSVCIVTYVFLLLQKFYRRYSKIISENALLLIEKRFIAKDYTIVEIAEIKDSDLLPFKTNHIRIVFNSGSPFNNEYYYKVKALSSRSTIETFWVHIEYLFRKPIGFIVKNNHGMGVDI